MSAMSYLRYSRNDGVYHLKNSNFARLSTIILSLISLFYASSGAGRISMRRQVPVGFICVVRFQQDLYTESNRRVFWVCAFLQCENVCLHRRFEAIHVGWKGMLERVGLVSSMGSSL
jgi:hypothetical protein